VGDETGGAAADDDEGGVGGGGAEAGWGEGGGEVGDEVVAGLRGVLVIADEGRRERWSGA
jgi:hypothetical protein